MNTSTSATLTQKLLKIHRSQYERNVCTLDMKHKINQMSVMTFGPNRVTVSFITKTTTMKVINNNKNKPLKI